MFYWILTSSLLALKSRACIYIRMDACITNTGWCNGGSVLMSEKMQKLDENWFSFFFKQIFIQIYRWSSVFSVKHGDLDAAIPPPSLSSVSRCSAETRGGSRRSDTCALRAQAVISSARAAHRLCVSREECCPFSTGVKQKLLVTLCAADSCSCPSRCSLSGRHHKSAPLLLTIIRLTRRLSLSEQYYTYFKKVFLLYETYISVLCVSLILSKHEIIR